MFRLISSTVIAACALSLLFLEKRRPLRPDVQPKLPRDVRNLAIALAASPVVQFAETPLALALAYRASERRFGLVHLLPPSLRGIAAVLLMDYTLYLWHVLTHRVPFLWRFHRVHHVDLDLDVTTAIRFHFGEIALSVPFRAAQVWVIGISPQAFRVWQTLLFLSISFHHSNVRLPIEWDRRVGRVLMTPRLHGIHHSDEECDVNSNWSSGLTVWDSVHGSLRSGVPQETIRIGVPEFGPDDDVSLSRMLRLPLEPARVTGKTEGVRAGTTPQAAQAAPPPNTDIAGGSIETTPGATDPQSASLK